MKRQGIFLFAGVFLACFYLECNAFEYRDWRPNGRRYSLEAENIVDEVRVHHHRSRRELVLTNQTDCKNTKCKDKVEKTNHKYYTSQIISNGQDYWVDVQGNPKSVEHAELSDSYLLRQNFKLSFQFPYYGHLLDQVMLTTGGFLYMDTHGTNLMTQVQYLAPLMAYFSPNLTRDSKVLTLDDGSKLTVEWYKVLLHENATDRPFTFQCTLHKNGTIWFAYKEIPIEVDKIPSLQYHPVKVGTADAFVIRYYDIRRNIVYRYFYIYSVINITLQSVVNNAAVIFEPLPSCVSAQSCVNCMERTAETNFTCQWCPQTQKCSDGVDRHREEWERNKCKENAIKEGNNCVVATTTITTAAATTTTPTTTMAPTTLITKMSEERTRGGKQERRKSTNNGIGAGAIFGICLILMLVIGIAAWCVYAYQHPTSKSGIFLIEATRRPREFFRHNPRVSRNMGQVHLSDVKPQPLILYLFKELHLVKSNIQILICLGMLCSELNRNLSRAAKRERLL